MTVKYIKGHLSFTSSNYLLGYYLLLDGWPHLPG